MTTQNFYALLVGINDYSNPENAAGSEANLQGCVNDMEAWQRYVEKRAEETGYQLHLKTLKNEQATRQAIIDGFQQHLSRAQQDDVVLFFFAGHGSQEKADPFFWGEEPDHLNETLVCYDSRRPGGFDLADKELDNLIWEVTRNEPSITVILDCCHSGSGTRELWERRLETRMDDRALDTYVFADKRNQRSSSLGVQLLKGRHVLLAACRDCETAKETILEDEHHGVFSASLLKVLGQSTRELTHQEMWELVRHEMKGKTYEQTPQLEVLPEEAASDRHRLFLSQEVQDAEGIFTLAYDAEQKAWLVDGGAVQGWPEGQGDLEIEFEIYPYATSLDRIQERERCSCVGNAHAVAVGTTQTSVALKGTNPLVPKMLYKALLTKAPLPSIAVYLEGIDAGVKALRSAIEKVDPATVKIKEVAKKVQSTVVLHAKAQDYEVFRGPGLGYPTEVFMAELPYHPALPFELGEPMAHIARWQQLVALRNYQLGRIPRNSVQLYLVHEGKTLTGQEIPLHYRYEHGAWEAPRQVKVMLKNNSQVDVYCAVLNLSAQFGINPDMLPAGGIWLKAAQEVEVTTLRFGIPAKFLEQGVTEYPDILKLIASTKEFNARRYLQAKLGESPQRDAIMDRDAMREISRVPEQDDWMTQTVLLKLVKSMEIPADAHPEGDELSTTAVPELTGNEVAVEELWETDEDLLLAQLGQLSERSPIVTERPVGMRAEVLERSPIVTERPIAMRSELVTLEDRSYGAVKNLLAKGNEAFETISPLAYKVLCSDLGEGELAQELTKLMENNTEAAAAKAVTILGSVLLKHLNMPQTMAMVMATLVIKRAAKETSTLICENWQKRLASIPVQPQPAL